MESTTPSIGMHAFCLQAEQVSRDGPYRWLIFFKALVAITALALFGIHAYRKRKRNVYHRNTMVIYWFICCYTAGLALCYSILHTWDFFRLSLRLEPCERLVWGPLVLFLRVGTTVFTSSMDCALIILCVERVVCTMKISIYEDLTAPKTVTSFLLLMGFIWAIVYWLLLSPGIEWDTYLVKTTTINPKNTVGYNVWRYRFAKKITGSIQAAILIMIIQQFISLYLFWFVREWNRQLYSRIRKGPISSAQQHRGVSMKFQIDETLKVIAMFFPIVVAKCFMNLFGLVSVYTVQWLRLQLPVSIQMVFFEAVVINYLQTVVTPLFLMYKSNQLGRICRGSSAVSVNDLVRQQGQESFDDHFKRLADYFEKRAV